MVSFALAARMPDATRLRPHGRLAEVLEVNSIENVYLPIDTVTVLDLALPTNTESGTASPVARFDIYKKIGRCQNIERWKRVLRANNVWC